MRYKSWMWIYVKGKARRAAYKTLMFLCPKLHYRLMTYMASGSDVHRMIHAMAIVGTIAKRLKLEESKTLKQVSLCIRGSLGGNAGTKDAEAIFSSEYPGRAFVSAVVRNDEWSSRCRYLIQMDDVQEMINARIPGQAF